MGEETCLLMQGVKAQRAYCDLNRIVPPEGSLAVVAIKSQLNVNAVCKDITRVPSNKLLNTLTLFIKSA